MDKHTGLPWELGTGPLKGINMRQSFYIYDARGHCIAELSHEDIDNYENAAFIVKACNTHYDMVDALEAIQQEYHHIIGCSSSEWQHEINKMALDAIAKAKGE